MWTIEKNLTCKFLGFCLHAKPLFSLVNNSVPSYCSLTCFQSRVRNDFCLLRLRCFTIFSDENDFRENYYFFPCLVVFRKIFYSIVRKIKQKGQGGEVCIFGKCFTVCIFGKCFTKKLSVNHFLNFNKRFSD